MLASSSPEQPKQYSPAQLAIKLLREKSRDKRKMLREKRRAAAGFVSQMKKAVGTSDYRASNKGFIKQHKLPAHFKPLINGMRQYVYSQYQYIDKNGVTHSLTRRGKRKLFEILIVLITSCDFMSGQIGKPLAAHMDTTKHDAFMLEHAKRFGYSISSSTWYRYIYMLKSMNIFNGREIKLHGVDGLTIRSEASYKWLSTEFLRAVGVYRDTIWASIKVAYQKALDNGRSFVWRQHNSPVGYRPAQDLFTAYTPSTAPPQ